MRHDQKPHNKRKIFKRKHGGPKFTLNGGLAKTTFSEVNNSVGGGGGGGLGRILWP